MVEMTRSEVGATIDRASELLGRGKVHESEKFSYQAALHQVDGELARILDGGTVDEEVLLQYCLVATKRRLWNEAARRWLRLREASDRYRDLATFRLASTYREQGNPFAATAELQRLESVPVSKKAYKRLEAKITETSDRQVSQGLVARAVQELSKGRSTAGGRLLAAAMLVQGYPEDEVDETGPLLDALGRCWSPAGGAGSGRRTPRSVATRAARRLAAKAGVGTAGGPSSAAEPVVDASSDPSVPAAIVCGFGWSGSGALFDYCDQLDRVRAPYGATEVPWLGRPWGVRGVLRAGAGGQRNLRPAAARFVVGSVLGLGDVGGGAGVPSSEMLLSLGMITGRSPFKLGATTEQRRAARAGAVDLLARLAEAGSGGLDPVELERLAGRVLGALLVPAGVGGVGGERVLLYNNTFHGPDVSLVRLVPGGVAVPVFRDPRDQFVSRLHEAGGRKSGDVDAFIATLEGHYRKCRTAMSSPELADRIYPVRFEEFVTDRRVRDRFLERLGLDPGRVDEASLGYHPDQSLANIGIHRTHPDRDQIARIEAAFPDDLIDAR